MNPFSRLCGYFSPRAFARKNSESGNALLEAAITIPPTIFLLFYMVDAGRMMHNHHVFTQIVADTLQYASGLNEIESGTVQFESGAYQGCAADAAVPQCTKQRMILFRAKQLVERDTRLSVSDLVVTSTYSTADDRITLRVSANYGALFPAIWQHAAISASGGVSDVSNG